MSDIARAVRIAFRGLRRTPTFTVAATLILGLGIGTSVAMFTVFRAVLIDRLPIREPQRVVVLTTYRDPAVEFGLLLPDVKRFRQDARTLQSVAGYAHWGTIPSPLLDGDRSVVLNRSLVTGNFFEVLGARAALGRLLRSDDEAAGAAPVMVLSYSAWQQQFGADPGVIGKHVIEPYTQTPYTVVGVAPPGLEYPAGVQTWSVPTAVMSENLSIIVVARLAAGATPAAAQAELLSIKQRISPELRIAGAKAVPFTQAALGDVKPVLVVLTAAVALLLVIACVNVGNLLLLRATARARELAIRRALGASYGDVVRQLLLESTVLATGGGALGLLCAHGLLRLLLAYAPTQLPRTDVIRLDGTPILAAIGATFLAVMLFGLVPAFLGARADVASALRFDARSGRDSAARRRLRQLLVASQTTLALIMLAGSILLARSLAKLEGIDLGYEPEHLSILAASWPATTLDTPDKLYPIGEEIMRRWRAIPGVVAVTPIMIPPLNGPNVFVGRVDFEGQSPSERQANPIVPVEAGGEDYFRVFDIPIRKGRGFENADDERAPYVAVVSESMARRLWPNENPIGKRISYWTADSTKWRTVVGVAGDVHLRELRAPTPTIYIPWRQANFWQATLAVRTTGTLASVLPALRREMRAAEPRLALWYAKPMDALLAAPLARPRTSALLMSSFGVAALLLAAIGLYGLMASVVRDRTREIGIRMALGAEASQVRRDVIRQALIVSGAGAIVGLVGAFATSRLLTTLLYDVSPTDPVALAAACGVLLLVVLAAAYVPARRATKIDPASALRAE